MLEIIGDVNNSDSDVLVDTDHGVYQALVQVCCACERLISVEMSTVFWRQASYEMTE